jgi:hypothetical protein
MHRASLFQLAFVIAVLLMVGLAWSTFANCQLCWKENPTGGICQDPVNPNPSMTTLENCQGGLKCKRYEFGTLCWPDCIGDPCYWV